jgi:TonB family protein
VAVADLVLVRSMRALLILTCAMTVAILPHAARCQVAVKGRGPVLIKVLPAYPYAARDQHLEGSGLYRLNIKPDGTVDSVTILKSTGHRLLDEAAVDAFRQWRFKPGALHALKIPINFTMKGVTY